MPRAVTRLRSDVVVVTAILLVAAILVAGADWIGSVSGGRTDGTRPTGDVVPLEIAAETLDGHAPIGGDAARLVTILDLTSTHAAFGGLSGLDRQPSPASSPDATSVASSAFEALDGARFLAVTDHGRWLSFRARTDADGRLLALEEARLGALRDLDGRPVFGRIRRDAEETTPWGDGLLVAFEGEHRLVAHEGPEPLDDPSPRLLTAPPEAVELEVNDGFEAMTELGDGRVLLVAEAPKPDDDGARSSLRAWVGDPATGRWSTLRIAATGSFQATAATLLPWGEVLLLERHYDAAAKTVTARLSALPVAALEPTDLEPTARVETRELLRFGTDDPVDNFEGLAVVPVTGGAIALLLADDNFAGDQRTLLAQVFVAEPGARHAARPSPTGGR